jgi:hypothetical protein
LIRFRLWAHFPYLMAGERQRNGAPVSIWQTCLHRISRSGTFCLYFDQSAVKKQHVWDCRGQLKSLKGIEHLSVNFELSKTVCHWGNVTECCPDGACARAVPRNSLPHWRTCDYRRWSWDGQRDWTVGKFCGCSSK